MIPEHALFPKTAVHLQKHVLPVIVGQCLSHVWVRAVPVGGLKEGPILLVVYVLLWLKSPVRAEIVGVKIPLVCKEGEPVEGPKKGPTLAVARAHYPNSVPEGKPMAQSNVMIKVVIIFVQMDPG